MRRVTALAALAFALPACTSSNTQHPAITDLRNGTLSVSPLPVCTGVGATSFGSPNPTTPSLTLIGSGFIPNVNLVSDDPQVAYGSVRFIGATTVDGAVQFVSAQELTVVIHATQFAPGQPLVPPGAYDFVFIDSDLGEFRQAHGVDFVLPPQVVGVEPSSICPDRDETITVAGSDFTPGPTSVFFSTSSVPSGPGIPATATADTVIVTIPAGSIRPSGSSQFVVKDVSGCTSSAFTVNTTAGCGP